MKCVNCGTENPDGAKFCIKCGASLAAPATAAQPPAAGTPAPPTPPAPPAPPAQTPAAPHAPEAAYAPPGPGGPAVAAGGQTPAFGTPPLAYTPPNASVPPTGAMGGPGPGAPMPPGYGMPVAKKHTKLYLGSLLALLGGIVAVITSWLPWAGSFGVNITGWDIFNGADNLGQRFLQIVDGKPTFTALPMIIAGGLIVLLALLMLLSRKKGWAAVTLILALGVLAMSVITMVSMKTLGSGGISFGLSLQYGIYLLGAFGVVGVLGSIIALAD